MPEVQKVCKSPVEMEMEIFKKFEQTLNLHQPIFAEKRRFSKKNVEKLVDHFKRKITYRLLNFLGHVLGGLGGE